MEPEEEALFEKYGINGYQKEEENESSPAT